MTNYEAFRRVITSSTNLLFLMFEYQYSLCIPSENVKTLLVHTYLIWVGIGKLIFDDGRTSIYQSGI